MSIDVFVRGGVEVFRKGGPVEVVLGARGSPGPRAAQELGVFVQGFYAPNELLLRYECGPQARLFAVANSRASSAAPATASTSFAIKKNGSPVGSVAFAPASSDGVVSLSDGALDEGDVLEIVAPPDQDATLSNVTIILGEIL